MFVITQCFSTFQTSMNLTVSGNALPDRFLKEPLFVYQVILLNLIIFIFLLLSCSSSSLSEAACLSLMIESMTELVLSSSKRLLMGVCLFLSWSLPQRMWVERILPVYVQRQSLYSRLFLWVYLSEWIYAARLQCR